MKTFTAQIAFLAVLLALPVFVSAQVFEGDLTLSSQAEVDAFNYTEVTGNLTIGNPEDSIFKPPTDIKNLKPLSILTKVGNTLSIWDNPQLKDLQGLENLSSVKNIDIEFNDQLQDLQGLNHLTSIEGDIYIGFNDSLIALQVLENITTFNGSLIIVFNRSLNSLQDLENLTTLNGLLNIAFNESLTSLQGLENFTTLNGGLILEHNEGLTSLQGVENLTINGYLIIVHNDQLITLQGLENLQLLENLEIYDNPNLNDCCAIADLVSKTTGEINIEGNGPNCNSVKAIQESCPPVIPGFTLVNAVTDQDLFDLVDTPAVINILETGKQLNIRANTAPGTVGSVVFELDGFIVNTENAFPYALFDDFPTGNYLSQMFALGRHTLTATPYDENNGKGQAGEPLTLEFVVIDQPLAVISFTLVTTTDNQDQYELKDKAIISLQQFDPAKLNIRANTSPKEVGSVVFALDGKKFRTENVFPYAMAGDNPPGNYLAWTPTLGEHILKATPYTDKNGGGEKGTSLTISFTVVEEQLPNVQRFTLVNATNDQDITTLEDGNILDLAALGNPALNVRANTTPDKVDSVLFEFHAPSSETINWNEYQLVGDAFSIDDCYTLTPDEGSKVGAAWNKHPIDLNYNFDFTFTINLCGGADGGDLGYYDVFQRLTKAVQPSLGIELDIWNNNEETPLLYDPPDISSHITLVKNGNPLPITELVEISPEINNCADRLFRIVWNSTEKTLEVYLDGEKKLFLTEDIVESVFSSNPQVYFGFTGGTGAFSALQTFCNAELIYDGPSITTITRTERQQPYALFGDDTQGDYFGKLFKPGKYTLTATPYTKQQGLGDQGKSLTITFEVKEDMAKEKVARKASEVDKEKETFTYAVEQGAAGFMVYPNPSTGIVKIEFRGTVNESIHIAVFDLTGRMIYTTERNTPFSDQIDLQKFSKGLKIVKVQSAGAVFTERIIIE